MQLRIQVEIGQINIHTILFCADGPFTFSFECCTFFIFFFRCNLKEGYEFYLKLHTKYSKMIASVELGLIPQSRFRAALHQ